MTKTVDIDEAKTTLSTLIERALTGEEVIVAKAGTPVVRLVPIARRRQPRRPGRWKGRVRMARDFNVLPPDRLDPAA